MANTHKKMISQLTQAFSSVSVAQFKSVLQNQLPKDIQEFFCSKKWKKLVAEHSKHLTPHQAFCFGSAISKHFGEEKPFQDFVKNCEAFDTYLDLLKESANRRV